MDINTIVKAGNATLAVCAVAMIGIAVYCDKKQKNIDKIIGDGKQFTRGGVTFTIFEAPAELFD
jgi:hypothetical protein